LSRRNVIKGFAKAAGALAVGVAATSQAADQTTGTPEPCIAKNPYGGGPNTGITLPPYYRPTPSVANANTFFRGMEELGADEMRISFVGSTPVPPTLAQAGTAIMVELGNGKRFFFDVGPGCLRNIVALQVPLQMVNDIFITHLHVDHYADGDTLELLRGRRRRRLAAGHGKVYRVKNFEEALMHRPASCGKRPLNSAASPTAPAPSITQFPIQLT
jgi:hypothetical protein